MRGDFKSFGTNLFISEPQRLVEIYSIEYYNELNILSEKQQKQKCIRQRLNCQKLIGRLVQQVTSGNYFFNQEIEFTESYVEVTDATPGYPRQNLMSVPSSS